MVEAKNVALAEGGVDIIRRMGIRCMVFVGRDVFIGGVECVFDTFLLYHSCRGSDIVVDGIGVDGCIGAPWQSRRNIIPYTHKRNSGVRDSPDHSLLFLSIFSALPVPFPPVRIPKIRPTIPGQHVHGDDLQQLQSVRTNLRKTHHYRTDQHGTGFSIGHLLPKVDEDPTSF